jgi:nuclear transport factor 2 (NTF2) superfamily protein
VSTASRLTPISPRVWRRIDDAEVTANQNGASKDPKADAAVRFAVKVLRERGHVTEDDVNAVKSAGYDDAQVIEIVLHVALNTWTNYINVVGQDRHRLPHCHSSQVDVTDPTSNRLRRQRLSHHRRLSPRNCQTRTRAMSRPPLPPFTAETAAEKVRVAEDAWNTRDPARVALAYTTDSCWRNRAEFLQGREAIETFLTRKWQRELDYRLTKELWVFRGNRTAVRFAYEWHDHSGSWLRSYGNENWEFDEHGLMRLRIARINDAPIKESERKYRWPLGRRPNDHRP